MAAVSFTFGSFGDIFTLIQLIQSVVTILKGGAETSAEIKNLVNFLDGFRDTIMALQQVLPGVSIKANEARQNEPQFGRLIGPDALNGIVAAVNESKRLMKDFEQAITPMVHDGKPPDTWQRRITGIWRTFRWTRSVRDQAIELRTALCAQAQIILLIQNTAMVIDRHENFGSSAHSRTLEVMVLESEADMQLSTTNSFVMADDDSGIFVPNRTDVSSFVRGTSIYRMSHSESPEPTNRTPELGNCFDRFDKDPKYGPVLDAFLAGVVDARIELNPLLAPPADRSDERPHITWDMLWPLDRCQRSWDPEGGLWAEGRDTPATWPRITSLRLISCSFPWTILVEASNLNLGVTCGDVMESIATFMYGRVSKAQMDSASPVQRALATQSYWHNRSTAPGVPGGQLVHALLRCDWLSAQTIFGGIVVLEESTVNEVSGGVTLPCTFELKCSYRSPMLAEEGLVEYEASELEAYQMPE